jgi:hypothetical protein
MRKTVAGGNGNELCEEGGMRMAEHWQIMEWQPGMRMGFVGSGEWEWQNTE